MSNTTSEQLLKALERSKDDLSDLLDQAATIAGVQVDQQNGEVLRLNKWQQTDTNAFREQWLLRWIIKRLNEALPKDDVTNPNEASLRFAVNLQTWSFICHLIATIPRQKALDILIERNFTKLLTNASTRILGTQLKSVSASPFIVTSENEHERPCKRVRLSPDVKIDSDQKEQMDLAPTRTALYHFLRVIDAWGKLLEPEKSALANVTRSVRPSWADSVKDAAEFVGFVFKCADLYAFHYLEQPEIDIVESVMKVWLQMWHIFSASINTSDRIIIPKAFNESCLNPLLGLYSLVIYRDVHSLIAIKNEIEKCVALYTVLPLRSVFDTKFAPRWKNDQKVVSWQDIEPIMKMLHAQLGTALRSTSYADYQITSLKDPKWARYLISIASRLIPKEDVRRRQKERMWLEAFTLCLMHLAFPADLPQMELDKDGMLQPSIDALPPVVDRVVQHPEIVLEILIKEELQFSLPVKTYLTANILSSRKRPLSVDLMSKTVDLDANVFMPDAGQSSTNIYLNRLSLAIMEHKTYHEYEYEVIVRKTVPPLIEAFAKAREFEGLLVWWLPNLEEALRVRATATSPSYDIPSAYLWDDENLFDHFEALCGNFAPMSFVRNLLNDVVHELKAIEERIGPTTDIFAKLAILDRVIRTKGKAMLESPDATVLTALMNAIVNAVQQPNDYQGQKWRLWTTLTTLRQLDSRFDCFESIKDALESACKRFHKVYSPDDQDLQHSQLSALLVQQDAIFSLLVNYYASDNRRAIEEGSSIYKVLSKQIKKLSKVIGGMSGMPMDKGLVKLYLVRTTLWNGQLNTLRSFEQLAFSCLGHLVANLAQLAPNDSSTIALLSPITSSLIQKYHDASKLQDKTCFIPLALKFLAYYNPDDAPDHKINDDENSVDLVVHSPSINGEINVKVPEMLAASAITSITDFDKLQKVELVEATLAQDSSASLEAVTFAAVTIEETDDVELRSNTKLAKTLASAIMLDQPFSNLASSALLQRLEQRLLIIKQQSGILNQAIVDSLLAELVTFTSASGWPGTRVAARKQDKGISGALFDHSVSTLGLLLAKYRRRLTGRTHLLLPVLQNLLRCFFYTPDRAYVYQNATTVKQRQAFRSSLPPWLDEALPASSAVHFSRIIMALCNPTTASARSAHHNRRKDQSSVLELNDETKKAKRIAVQYMQYLVMEYCRCILDGVIKPEVREKLTHGLFSVLDAMDKELMKAMNAAMDPSSRAIFKGLYDDWTKHWKWNQT